MNSTMQRKEVAFTPGATFEGCYEIVAKLAEGGFGGAQGPAAQRWTAGRAEILYLPEHGDVAQTDARIARFLREAQLCAQLRPPNIVQIVDSGQTANGTLYIAFAFAPRRQPSPRCSHARARSPAPTLVAWSTAAARSLGARGQTRAAYELLSAARARVPEGETASMLNEVRALVSSYATK